MNIKMQCCGIIILFVIFIFYQRKSKLHLKTEKLFLSIFVSVTVSLILDVASMVSLFYIDDLPGVFVDVFCKAYLVSLIWVCFYGLLYVCSDIFVQTQLYQKRASIFYTILTLGTILVLALPIYKNTDDIYLSFTYGPSVLTTYALCVAFLAITIFQLYHHKEKINPKRRKAAFSWLVIWITATIIQFIFNKLLLVGFASSIGVLVIYLSLENPETNIDRRTGLFTPNALNQYLRQVYGSNTDVSLINVIMSTPFIPNDRTKDALISSEVLEFASTVSTGIAFSDNAGNLFFVTKQENYDTLLETIDDRFNQPWGPKKDYIISPNIIGLPATKICKTAEDIIPCINYAYKNNIDLAETGMLVFDESIANAMYEEQILEQTISDAINEDRIVVYYQPIYSIKEKRFVSAEALVRIVNTDGSIIPPGEFINSAEQNGSILKIGELVFKKVCHFISSKYPENYGLEYIEVNLSTVQASYEFLADSFIEIMEWYNVDPSMINLEITESASIYEKKLMLDNMKKLIDYGVSFSLDDFGTGNSNLNYIVDMPVRLIKFDRDMIMSYFETGKAKYVMDAAMHMIHGLKLEIVSEGIETKEMLDTMENLGISYIQGYYFSKPIPEDEFIEFMEKNNSPGQRE